MQKTTLQKALEDRLLHARDINSRMSLLTKLLLRVVARRLNRELFAPVILRACERGVINSYQMHELCADFDPTQRGVVGFVTERRPEADRRLVA
jgi:hypothetical protein